MATTTAQPPRYTQAQLAAIAERQRHRVIGFIMLLLGLAGFALFAINADPTAVSTFGLNTGRTAVVRVGDLVVPTQATITILSSACLFIGGYQIVRGFGKASNAIFGLIILFFIASFLTWATSDKSINLAAMINSTLLRAVPLTLGALSGIMSERSGVVNIAIEGMMLAGALTATIAGSVASSLWIGVIAAVLTGVLLSLFHGVLSIRYKVDQIISGTVINIFSVGITSFISAKFLSEFPELNNPGTFRSEPTPLLSAIPVIGPILFDNNFFTYAMFGLLVVIHIALFYTRWGLRTRAVGEHPKAADTLGINVFRTRYIAVLLSGALAGFAGAYFTLGSVGRFDEGLTAGRGFIALAAMIFGNWTPFGAFGAALIFGFADSLQSRLAILNVPIPSQFLLMAPYIATMIALAGLIGRTTPPAADGKPYDKA
ncbi:MAG: ABC transporter permease [Thermoflexales bacterium]|nr:ABC transporter permease [Thermoflexales bacterium]MDW8351868.1 ABC transporter permease [Anaerolineae bacterium]